MEMVSCAQRISVELISKMRRNKNRSVFLLLPIHWFHSYIHMRNWHSAMTLIGSDRCVPRNCAWDEQVLWTCLGVGCRVSNVTANTLEYLRMRLIYSYSTFELHRSTLSPVCRSRAGVYDTQLYISLLFQRKPIETRDKKFRPKFRRWCLMRVGYTCAVHVAAISIDSIVRRRRTLEYKSPDREQWFSLI